MTDKIEVDLNAWQLTTQWEYGSVKLKIKFDPKLAIWAIGTAGSSATWSSSVEGGMTLRLCLPIQLKSQADFMMVIFLY